MEEKKGFYYQFLGINKYQIIIQYNNLMRFTNNVNGISRINHCKINDNTNVISRDRQQSWMWCIRYVCFTFPDWGFESLLGDGVTVRGQLAGSQVVFRLVYAKHFSNGFAAALISWPDNISIDSHFNNVKLPVCNQRQQYGFSFYYFLLKKVLLFFQYNQLLRNQMKL